MTTHTLVLLVLLFFGHWAADFTHLLTVDMLKAKKHGTPVGPIAEHAFTHAWIVSVIVCFFAAPPVKNIVAVATFAGLFEFLTHWGLDILKGRLTVWWPRTEDFMDRPYWYVMGLDQYAHYLVLLLIAYNI